MAERRTSVSISVRGRLTLRDHAGDEIALRPRERAVLAAVVAAHPHPVGIDRIVPLLWPDDPPATASASIRNHVRRIRASAPDVIVTVDDGYRLAEHVRVELTGSGPVAPFDDLPDSEAVEGHRARLRRLIAAADEALWADALSDGATPTLVAALEAGTEDEPYREQRWALLVRAHAALGDRRAALDRAEEARRALAEVGVRPGHELIDLERRILDDDPVLRARSPWTEVESPSDLPIVGIGAAVAEAIDRIDAGGHVAIDGPAGSGKTTLVGELVSGLGRRGWRHHVVRCTSEPSVPLEPFAALVSALRDRDPDTFDRHPGRAELSVLFPNLPATGEAAAVLERPALFEVVVDLLTDRPAPTMVVVEDIHWASPVTRQLIEQVIEAAGRGNLAVVVTSRLADLLGVDIHRLAVPSWELPTVGEYVDRAAPAAPAEWRAAATDWIHRQTGGLPLFVRELTIGALDAADTSGPFTPPDGVPDLVADALRHRLIDLPSRPTIELVAVLGVDVAREDVLAIEGHDAAEALAGAERRDVLVQTSASRLGFRHELLHRSVLDLIPSGRRVELHDRVAEYLRDDPERVGELAIHAAAAAELDPARATHALTRAARRYAQQFAWEDADALASECLALLERLGGRPATWCDVAVLAGRCRTRAGLDGSTEILHAAATTALDIGEDAIAAEAIAELCRLGPTSEIGTISEQLGDLIDRADLSLSDEASRARVLGAAAMLYSIAEPERGRDSFERALALAGSSGAVDVEREVLPLAVVCLGGPADQERREAIVDHIIERSAAMGDPLVSWGAEHLRMANQVQRGDPGMRTTLATLRELSATMRSRAREFETCFWSSAVALIDGDVDASEQFANDLLGFVGSIADSRVVGLYGGSMLALRLTEQRAGELLPPLIDIASEQSDVGAWHAAAAVAATQAGDLDVARRELAATLADDGRLLAHDSIYTAALVCAAEAASVVGARDQVDWLHSALEPWSGRWSFFGAGTFGPIDLSLARLASSRGDTTDARRYLDRTRRQVDRLDAPVFASMIDQVEAAAD